MVVVLSVIVLCCGRYNKFFIFYPNLCRHPDPFSSLLTYILFLPLTRSSDSVFLTNRSCHVSNQNMVRQAETDTITSKKDDAN